MNLPKVLHFIWFQGWEQAPAYLREVPHAWARLNPEWQVRKWDGVSLDEFVSKHFPNLLATYRGLSIIKACDLARMLLIYHYGGIYLDADLSPVRPLATLLDSPVRYCHSPTRGVPTLPYDASPLEWDKLRVVLCREHQPIQGGYSVANGVIIAEPGVDWIKEFVLSRVFHTSEKVLAYAGPWALTRFIRANAPALQKEVAALSPFYFLWEYANHGYDVLPFTVATHGAKNHWGDHSRTKWWDV